MGYKMTGVKMTKPLDTIWIKLKKDRIAYLFAFPYLLLFFTFTVLPVVISIFFSLTDFNSITIKNFVGFDNYIRLIYYGA